MKSMGRKKGKSLYGKIYRFKGPRRVLRDFEFARKKNFLFRVRKVFVENIDSLIMQDRQHLVFILKGKDVYYKKPVSFSHLTCSPLLFEFRT